MGRTAGIQDPDFIDSSNAKKDRGPHGAARNPPLGPDRHSFSFKRPEGRLPRFSVLSGVRWRAEVGERQLALSHSTWPLAASLAHEEGLGSTRATQRYKGAQTLIA